MKDRVGALGFKTISVETDWDPIDGVVAVYFRVSANPIKKTVEHDNPDVLIDIDRNGDLVGIELTNPSIVSMKTVLKSIAKKFKSPQLEQFSKHQVQKVEQLVAGAA